MKRWFSFGILLGILVLLFAVSYVNAGTHYINDCQVLDEEEGVYILNNSINNNNLTTHCININALNITLDCQGHSINSIQNYSGVYSNKDNTIIKNCDISMNSYYPSSGIYLEGANNAYIYNNILNNQNIGFLSFLSNNSRLVNNKIINNEIGVYVLGSNNLFKDNNILNNDYDVIIYSYANSTPYSSPPSLNNTFLNCSYNSSEKSEIVTDDGSSELIRKWYYRAKIVDSSNNLIEDAQILIYNKDNNLAYELITDTYGFTDIVNIADYINQGGNKSYYSPYKINVSKTGYIPKEIEYVVNENDLNYIIVLDTLNESTNCNGADINGDGKVDMIDSGIVSDNWGRTDCNDSNSWCNGADINRDGKVDLIDLGIVGDNWGKTNCNDFKEEKKMDLCNGADINNDGKVDIIDLGILGTNWRKINCNDFNNWCKGTDISKDGKVGSEDLKILRNNWKKTDC